MERHTVTEAEIQLLMNMYCRFQHLFPEPSWVGAQELHPAIKEVGLQPAPAYTAALVVAKQDCSKWKRHYD